MITIVWCKKCDCEMRMVSTKEIHTFACDGCEALVEVETDDKEQ